MGKTLACGLAWLFLAVAGLGVAPARASDIPEVKQRTVQAVIGAQLGALALDDAARAFSFASPAIQERFGDAATFMAMVREGYPMLIRPAAVSYLRALAQADKVLQPVLVRDRDGLGWIAIYELTRQPDMSWRINGCAVQPDDGKSAT